jgi:hypothetical protein
MYPLIRIFHLLTLTCIFPFAAYYVKHMHPEFVQNTTGGTAAFILIGSLFLVIFHVLFEVRYFPLDEKGAGKSFLAFGGNIAASSFIGDGGTYFGSYSACVRIGVMYFVYFGLMTLFFMDSKERKKRFYYTNNGYITLLLFLVICSTANLYLLFPYYKDQVMSEKNGLIVLLGVAMLGVDIYFHTKNLLKHNMFQFDSDADGEFTAREDVMMKWGIPGFILILAGYVVMLIILCNESIT